MSTHEIDLRSDTVTKPNEEMRRAMYEAEVADDSYDGDPTVIRLQEMAAEMLGMEAALFVVSGTMGNLLGSLVNTRPGQEVILGDKAHQFMWEVGGIARIANCVTHTVPFRDGFLDPQEIEEAVRGPALEATTTAMISVENTSNTGGGKVIPPEHLAKIAAVAKKHNLKIHMDGARFWNAVIASGRPASDFTQYLSTIAFCLSKGLGAPFGGILGSSRENIEKAITFRQMLGGGMRQAGVMAAAGIVAMKSGVSRLAEDHANAQTLARGLAEMFPGSVNPAAIQTNLVHINMKPLGVTGAQLQAHLAGYNIRIFPNDDRMRLTTHRMVTAADIDLVLDVFSRLPKAARRAA